MNKRIRSLIDEIFSQMKMTAENLALRDELMANAQDRYEDALRAGKSEEEAFSEVASSLGDVQALLRDMNAQDETEETEATEETEEPAQTGEAEPAASDAARCDIDLGETLNKALSAIGDWGRQLVPQAKKLARQVDEATGGALDELGKAAQKGMRDAQKAADDAFSRLSGRKSDAPQPQEERTPAELREAAKDVRAQAEIKQAVGDQEGARALRAQAYAMETRADALEQAQAMRSAAEDAARQADAAQQADDAQPSPAPHAPDSPEDAEDAERFAQAVDDLVREATQAAGAQDAQPQAADAGAEGEASFPAAGLRGVDIELDEDDVTVEAAAGDQVTVCWSGMRPDGQPVVKLDGHTLRVRRRNPDVFKTFFSVFVKKGGRITIGVPRGYAADYRLSTTSGDIRLSGVDADGIEIKSTSGDVRVEPDTGAGAAVKEIAVGTVSGDATVSAVAQDVKVNTVSGDLFVSCDANRVDVDAVSADVHVEGACDEWEVSTVSGDATLVCTVAPTRKIQINTVSGDARVMLPGEIRGFAAELSGMGGHIENEFGPDRYGTCALPIRMETVSGDLIITRV